MLKSFRFTRRACYLGYITQAITINFLPLLFLTFESEFGVTLSQIALLIGINFSIQLAIDFLSIYLIDRIHQRAAVLFAHICAAAGLLSLATLPYLLPHPFVGLLISVVVCGIGGGLIEVLISPIMEACPGNGKAASMSLLHSFYCWGQAGVILLSVLFFAACGIANWRYLSCLFALIPLFCVLLFSVVPMERFGSEEKQLSVGGLLRRRIFPWLLLMMICAGAAEMVMSQWASSFAESGLKVSKSMGDLLGPCLFALLMGGARLLYAKLAHRIPLLPVIAGSGLLCIISYLLAALAPQPLVALLGCALCGFSVGVFWPGIYSIAAAKCPEGAGAMFAFLALGGDVGCLIGPTVAGGLADRFGGDLRLSFLLAVVIPSLLVVAALRLMHLTRQKKKQ